MRCRKSLDVVSKVVEHAAALLPKIRAKNPRVHCITNTVAQAFTANTLLAAGATPSVTTSPEEIAGFVAGADNLLVNLGTLDRERREAIGVALDAAATRRLPWVLDPVFVDRSPSRLEFARTLVARKPAVIRLNAAELAALAGEAASPDCARRFAGQTGAIIALTGEVDVVTDGKRLVNVAQRRRADGQGHGHGLRGIGVCRECPCGREGSLARDGGGDDGVRHRR